MKLIPALAVLPVVLGGPYLGKPVDCTGSCFVKAGEFDTGGEGYAYHNIGNKNNGPYLRSDSLVNVDSKGAISYIFASEWYEYEVRLSAATYDVKYVLSGVSPSTVEVFVTLDNSCSTSAFATYKNELFSTGGYQFFEDIYGGSLKVAGGDEVIRICFVQGSFLNFKGFSLSKAQSSFDANNAFGGVPQIIPGNVAAVKFDNGGDGISYKDLSPIFTPKVRVEELVTGSSTAIGYFKNGEWFSYTVSVAADGKYGLNYMISSGLNTPIALKMHLIIDSTDCSKDGTGSIDTDFRGEGWSTFSDYGAGDVELSAGIHVLTICFDVVSSINFSGMRFGAAGSGSEAVASIPSIVNNFKLAWFDEFDGTKLNKNIWDYNYGNSNGWGNNEKQYYQEKNVIVANGFLTIEAVKEWAPDGSQYTSGKIVSRGGTNPYKQMYGRIETRARFDSGQGLWPAFWMMPNGFNMASPYGRWPQSGEIDIFEGINSMSTAHNTIHFGSVTQHAFKGCSYWSKESFTGFHTHAVEWAPWGHFKYYIDGKLTCDINQWWTGGGAYPAPFNQPFYVILNLAVGGNWPGSVDDSIFANGKKNFAIFDYVHVYDWPQGRRLDDGSFDANLPDGWELPGQWDPENNTWIQDKPTPSKHINTPSEHAFTPGQCSPMPYLADQNGEPIPWFLPVSGEMVIGAEFFDVGPAGCAYGDSTPHQNLGNNNLRMGTGVDLMEYDYATYGPYVSFMEPGEWLSYTVFSTEDATYWLEVAASSVDSDGKFSIVINSSNCEYPEEDGGVTIVDRRSVEKSNATEFSAYGSIVQIPQGVHQLTFCVISGMLNLDVIRFKNDETFKYADETFGNYEYTNDLQETKYYSHCGTDPNGSQDIFES